MLKVNHSLTSTAGCLAVLAITQPAVVANPTENLGIIGATLAGGMFGALIPDFDIKIDNDIAGFVFKVLFFPFPKLRRKKISAGHRTYSHSILAVLFFLILALIGGLFGGHEVFSGMIGVVSGVVFHLISDMTTVSGVPLLWPYSTRKFHVLPKPMLIVTGKTVFEYWYAAIIAFFCVMIFVSQMHII